MKAQKNTKVKKGQEDQKKQDKLNKCLLQGIMTQPQPIIDFKNIDEVEKGGKQQQSQPIISYLKQDEKNKDVGPKISQFLSKLSKIPLVNQEVYKNDPKMIFEIEQLKRVNLKLEKSISYLNKEISELYKHVKECAYQPDENLEKLYNDLLQQHQMTKIEFQKLRQKYQQLQQIYQPKQQSVAYKEVNLIQNQQIIENDEQNDLIDKMTDMKDIKKYAIILLQKNQDLQNEQLNLNLKIENLENELFETRNELFETINELNETKNQLFEAQNKITKLEVIVNNHENLFLKIDQEQLEQKAIIIRSEIKSKFTNTYISKVKGYPGDLKSYFSTDYVQKSNDLDDFAYKLGIDQKEWALLKEDQGLRNSKAHPNLQYIKNKKQQHLYSEKVFDEDNQKTYQAFQLMIQFIESQNNN